jgi:hypothetical protein
MRSVPTIGDGGLDALLAKFRQGYADPGEQRFQFRHSLCRVLEGCNGLPHRVEMVLDWSSTAKDPESIAVVDELAADCLGSAGVIKDMLGLQPDLGSALAMVVELARDRLKAFPAKAPPWLETLRKLLAGQGFEATRQVLLARVRRELGGERALTRDGAAGEAKALNVLCDRLFCDAQGVYLGGAEMVVAIARRYARLDRPGGFGDLPSASGAAVDRQIKTWLDYEREAFGEARKRAAGTMILAAVRSVERAGRRDLAGAGALVAASGLPEAARRAIAAELGIA